jgi:hypothetical protein
LGSSAQAAELILLTKAGATLANAVLADVIAVPLFLAVRKVLEKSRVSV